MTQCLNNTVDAAQGSLEQVEQQLATARESLEGEGYRLNTLQMLLEITLAEQGRLESVSLEGLISTLSGTRAGKLDEKRHEVEGLQAEVEQCGEVIEQLTQLVANLEARRAELAEVEGDDPAADSPTSEAPENWIDTRDLERALEAGEPLVTYLNGLHGACTRVRGRSPLMSGGGALLDTAVQGLRNRAARHLSGHLAETLEQFCEQLERLAPGHGRLPEVAVLLPRLRHFANPASLASTLDIDTWAELEVMVRSVVDDLQEQLRRQS